MQFRGYHLANLGASPTRMMSGFKKSTRKSGATRTLLALLLLPAVLSGCQTSGIDQADTAAINVFADTSTTYFSPDVRIAELTSNQLRSQEICPVRSERRALEQAVPGPVVGRVGWGNYSQEPREFSRSVNAAAARYLFTGDRELANAAILAMERFANANAWRTRGHENSAGWAITEAVATLLPGWFVLRETANPTAEQSAAIDRWIDRLLERSRMDRNIGNHATMRAANEAMFGAMNGDDRLLRNAIEAGFLGQLDTMREDGSFPKETERGQFALVYTSRNIASMIMIAEIASSQGIEVYDLEVDGRSIRDAIGFLLTAYEDNSLVDQYAHVNRYLPAHLSTFTPDAQFDPFYRGGEGSWMILFANRFPTDPLTRELTSIVGPGTRLVHDTVGGWVTCMVGWSDQVSGT